MQVTLKQAEAFLPRLLKHHIVPYLHGSPGIGKSAIVKAIAKQRNLKLIDIRLTDHDPTDLQGYPIPNHETKKASHYPLETLPTTTTPLPINPETGKPYSGWLVLFDEFDSAVQAVQAAAYKVVLDRQVGQHDLHPMVFLIAAGNLETDNAIVNPMSTALISRFAHFYVELNHKEWMQWAASAGLDFRITAYMNYKPDHLYTFNPKLGEQPYACPRTWDKLSKVLGDTKEAVDTDLPLWASLLGDGVAAEFIEFLKLDKDTPTFDKLMADPVNTPIKEDLGVRWSIMSMLAHRADENNINQVSQVLERFSHDLQVVSIRELIRRHPQMLKHSDFNKWVTARSIDVLG